MRVLLDECLPKKLKEAFRDYEISTVPEMGWAGKTNGELLRLAKGRFDAFVTVDQNLQYQQNLEDSGMAVVLISVKNNRYETFKPLLARVRRALDIIQIGQIIRVEAGE